jgi:hypothetical protein
VSSTVAIICPECGSPLDFDEGDRSALCPACKTCLAIGGDAGITRFVIHERLDEGEARSSARKFLADERIDRRLSGSLTYGAGRLYFLPFWKLTGVAWGWRLTEKESAVREEDSDDNGLKSGRRVMGQPVRDLEVVSRHLEYSTPATSLKGFGLRGVALASSVLPLQGVNFEEMARRGVVVDAVKQASQVRNEALATARGQGGGAGVLRQNARITLAQERFSLIYYPVWRLEFVHRERAYPVVVDGINGTILKARFPGAVRVRLFSPLAVVTLVVYAWSVHALAGVAAIALCIAILQRRLGTLAPQRMLTFFTGWVERGEEVECG